MKTKRLRSWMAVIVALTLTMFMGGCKDENVGKVGVCPVVKSTDPAPSATSVALDKVITVTFNEAMNPATITPSTFTIQDATKSSGTMKSAAAQITGAMTYDATNYTMSFTPTALLKPSTTYTGRVSSTVKDLMGNALQTDFVWTFSTGAFLSPMVISIDPTNNATDVYLNKVVSATFSVPMDPTTLTATTFTVKQGTTSIAGAVSYSGTTAFFKPTSAFTPNTIYTGTITTGAKSASGASLAKDYVWTFTTGSISGPKVNSTDPANLATGVAFNKVITATFSEAMDPLKITSLTFTLMNGTTLVPGAVSYSGTTATFTPTSLLSSGTTYTATITTGAMNPAGTPLANDYVWSFNTIATLGPLGVDLKSVARFGIIAGVGVSNNAGFSEIHNMDVGIYPNKRSSITGFPPAIVVNGAMYASDDIAPAGVAAMLLQAQTDLTAAYNFAAAATLPSVNTVSGNQGGLKLTPGIYKTGSSLSIDGSPLTLDAQGDANAIWIFQIGSAFTTTAGGDVILIGGAQAKNVFWQVSSSATIGDYTSFKGNILSFSSITMGPYSKAEGRMLARNGSVVLTSTNIIDKP